MPLLRERSKLLQPKKKITENINTKWTLPEKKKLLVALRKLGPDNLELIHSGYLPHRTEKEIYWFLDRIKNKSYRKNVPKVSRPRVPIELWESMAEGLTCHDVDYSYALAEVFEKIANEEEHFPKNIPENPDWKLLYQYMAALMMGDDLPEVGQIEAAVLLDLTESLACHLKSLETSVQQSIMVAKYNILAERVKAKTNEEIAELTKKALDLDPAEFNLNQGDKPSSSGSSSSAASLNVSHSSASQESSQSQAGPDPIVVTPPTSSQNSSLQAGKLPSTDRHHSSRRLHLVGFRSASSRRGHRRKSVETALIPLSNLQKTALYSINPFGIPVRYLNPRAKPEEESAAVVVPAKAPSHSVVVHTAASAETQSQTVD